MIVRVSLSWLTGSAGLISLLVVAFTGSNALADSAESMPGDAALFLKTHCLRCHQGEKAHGKVDFALLTSNPTTVQKHYKTWKLAAALVERQEMPPEGEPQPSEDQRQSFQRWYQDRFEKTKARPAPFRVRRLSAMEYRNTLESLFGFPLKVTAADAQQTKQESSLVLKLMPDDPKGPSGYTNDTSDNPIVSVLWDNYAYLAEVALLKLFSDDGRSALETYSGPLSGKDIEYEHAVRLLTRFHSRAWRRPLEAELTAPHLKSLAELEGSALAEAVKKEMKVILMSPEFLYRGFLVDQKPGEIAAVDPFELAERLSYFLWADMPDTELLTYAESGKLSKPKAFRSQVNRMLHSPKSRSVAEIFAVQWLLIDEIDNVTKEVPYAAALKGQLIEFLNDLVTRDRPLRELIDSRTEFVNLYLANFYAPEFGQFSKNAPRAGVEVETLPLERIELRETTGRGGLLTMPGVLIMNKGAIQRGAWMLERILGEHLGEPPPDVPPVKPSLPGQKLTFRERFVEHRANKSCALCHDRIDPLGFAFDAYNEQGGFLLAGDAAAQAVGKFRPTKKQKPNQKPDPEIDSSGVLPSGESFQNIEELKAILVGSQWSRVVENLVRQTLAYALCRELEPADEPAIRELATELSRPGATWGDLIHGVTGSVPFQQTVFAPSP